MADIGASETLVTLRAMRFHARIGVLAHESEIAQAIEVDLSLWVDRPNEDVGPKTILDYRDAYDAVAGVVTGTHIRYLEEVAERIAAKALSLPLAKRARVAVRKMNVTLPGPLAYAEVAVERTRG